MSEHVKDTLYTFGGWLLIIGFFSLPFLGLLSPGKESRSSVDPVAAPESSYTTPVDTYDAEDIGTYDPNTDYAPSNNNPPPTEGYQSSCNPNYSSCVENSSYDLDCADVGEEVQVIGYDEYGLDGDGDGWGCESY